MTSVATGLKCTLFSREDKFGVDLLITNAGTSELLVVLPNPYTGVELFDTSGCQLPGSSMMVWQETPIRVCLPPGTQSHCSIHLGFPFWTAIDGKVSVKCRITIESIAGVPTRECCEVNGVAFLKLPSEDHLIREYRERKRRGETRTIRIASCPAIREVSGFVTVGPVVVSTDQPH